MLIIGFGAGVTAGTFTLYDAVERIVIVEIEPLVPEIAGRWFEEESYDVLNDPRTELIIDDGRHFLATTDEKVDIITTNPIHPWVKGAAALYTREFYELARARLKPGGLFTQWVPFYESDKAAVKSQVGTFVEAFRYTSIWNSQPSGIGYDVTLLGHDQPIQRSAEDILETYAAPEISGSLASVGIPHLPALLEHFAANGEDISPWLSDAQINRDRDLRLEYLAGTALDKQMASAIFREMMADQEDRQASVRRIFGLPR